MQIVFLWESLFSWENKNINLSSAESAQSGKG